MDIGRMKKEEAVGGADIQVLTHLKTRLWQVLSHGGRSRGDLWSSKNSKYYHGCCNASYKFPKAEAITHPNRYLAIATSRGLNRELGKRFRSLELPDGLEERSKDYGVI